jgi:carbamoyl-phosphate synthase large subunit
MSSPEKTGILVTGVGGGSVGHQILHALLLLGDKYDITVVDADAYSFGLYQTLRRYVVPLASSPDYIPAILKVIQQHKINVLMPGTEPELKVLAARRKEIEDTGCLVMANPVSVINLCANKYEIAQWLEQHGFGTPDTVRSTDWRELVARKGFPIVGKPCSNSSGSRNVAILENEIEVERYLAPFHPDTIIFQEYSGSGDEEYTVGLCLDGGSRIIDSIVLKRRLTGMTLGSTRTIAKRTYTLSTGYSQGFIVRHPMLQAECERLVQALGMIGPANIQCRVVGDKVSVFEVHPRFSGTTSLRADVGFNEPDILVRTFLHGEKIGRQNYQTDVAVIRAFRSVVVPMAEMDKVPRIT